MSESKTNFPDPDEGATMAQSPEPMLVIIRRIESSSNPDTEESEVLVSLVERGFEKKMPVQENGDVPMIHYDLDSRSMSYRISHALLTSFELEVNERVTILVHHGLIHNVVRT